MAAKDCRLSFQEIMELTELPLDAEATQRGVVGRFMSRRPAWLPGSDIDRIDDFCGEGKPFWHAPIASFGGHVYSQSGIAASRVLHADEQAAEGAHEEQPRRGIHTLHGYFTSFVFSDRPIFYEVAPITTAQYSFRTYLITARQPAESSSTPPQHGWDGPGGNNAFRFPLEDAAAGLSDLKPICFSATASFKLPEPHAAGVSEQEPPPQQRFARVLALRLPDEWQPAPSIDVDNVVAAIKERQGAHDNDGGDRQAQVGSFPAIDMRKVDMAAHNAERPLFDQRQLILYRILRPLDGVDALGGNAHALVHAYEADRNGLLMAFKALGFSLGEIRMVTTMSYSIVWHTNIDDAVMRHESQTSHGKPDWWIQEVIYTRAANGRLLMEAKIWSPQGVHVATVYQDGMLRARPGVVKPGRHIRL